MFRISGFGFSACRASRFCDFVVKTAVCIAILLIFSWAPVVASEPLPSILEDPHIIVFKAQRKLLLYSGTTLLRNYRTALGFDPVSPKTKVKDYATPEGEYYVCVKNPQSQFFLSLGISYPGPKDAERGLKEGRISKRQYDAILAANLKKRIPPWNTPLGGEIFIHGGGTGEDWTWGCVALDNKDMKELYAVIPVGTPVIINP